MTNEEIIKMAIEKAVENGYTDPCLTTLSHEAKVAHLFFDARRYPCELIFSHSFAKAFWGEQLEERHFLVIRMSLKIPKDGLVPAWQYHITQMVLEEDPVKYLEQFL